MKANLHFSYDVPWRLSSWRSWFSHEWAFYQTVFEEAYTAPPVLRIQLGVRRFGLRADLAITVPLKEGHVVAEA